MVVPTRDPARLIAYAGDVLLIGTSKGLLAVKLDLEGCGEIAG
jgi:hypothetical protein